jgi:O-antigen/teichoic acid export membrane protein
MASRAGSGPAGREDSPPGEQHSPLAAARALWSEHEDIIRNATSLLATTGLTSALGFGYWTLAARLFSQQSVGYSAAAISVVSLLSWLGVFGFPTMLIGELPRRKDGSALVSASILASGAGSLILSVAFVLIVPRFTASFDDVTNSPSRAALLCAAVVLTAMTLVFDSATIGWLRGGIQFTRNLTFVLVKMLTLVAAATVMHNAFGIGIFLSWIAAIPVSLVPLVVRLMRAGRFRVPRPDWKLLRSLTGIVFAHNWLNLAIQATPLLMPVIVASIVPAAANAGFFTAWTIVSLLYILPTHLSTVLFAVAAGDRQALVPKLRFALRASILLGLPAMAVLGLGARLILGLFGKGYAQVATLPMELLVLGYLPLIPKCYYVAVCRAVGKVSRAAAVLTGFAVAEIAMAIIGCLRGGLVGLAVAMLIIGVIEALVTLPAVIKAARTTSSQHLPVTEARVQQQAAPASEDPASEDMERVVAREP